jgi:DNA (cytosine-5)-methyltransferase 1
MEKILILKVLDLFSGIGGFSLALESTGHFETIAFVEKDEFCQKVLAKNFKGIPIEGDIRNVKGNRYEADVITGGFPCQPFSVAGKRKGTDDDRYLWDETIRVIRECKPRWFIGENVEGIINIQNGMVLRQVQNDLEEQGFEVRCLIVPASSKGAWHHRKRVWILANSNSGMRGRGRAVEQGRANKVWGFCPTKEEQPKYDIRSEAVGCNAVLRKEDVSNTKHQRFSQGMQSKTTSNGNRQRKSKSKETWWQTQSRVCGVPNGISYELDKNRAKRVKALGNSIVPQIVYEIGKAIILAELDQI